MENMASSSSSRRKRLMINSDSVSRKRLMNMAQSSSAIPHPQEKYDVFLSFRGVDTRDYFTSHLHKALRDKKVETYIDDRLERGDEISPALIKAIEQSKLSVIIFSKNYASSTWCLDELVHILRCRERYGQIVIPVFCGIDPSHVRKQEGSYAVAFAQLEQRFKDKDNHMLREWKDALTKAANLSDSKKIRPESELVETVIKDILTKLNCESSCDLKGLVGIEKNIENIESLLCIDSLDVRTIGIWGMGGIGKTTLAGAVYNRLSSKFDACCFLANVREESEKLGLNYLRNELLRKLLKDEHLSIGSPSIGSPFVRERLLRTKALIVLDDVNNSSQLESLVGDDELAKKLLGSGTRIIVTTRNRRLLRKRVDDDMIYEVKGLNFDDALQLFQLYAFENNSTTEEYTELSRMVVDYANGIPLALKVLGSSFLHCNNKDEWESELSKLRKDSNLDIMEVLRISYHNLGQDEKKIFLYIACLYKGKDINYAKRMLDLCDVVPGGGIRVLVDMSLISITNNHLGMHDLVQQMGWEIVREQDKKEPGGRDIIWTAEEAYHVLKNKTGTNKVEAIFLDMSKIEELYLGRKVFKTMYNLRLLKLYNFGGGSRVYVPDQGLKCLPDALRYFHWERCPLKSLPSKFSPCNLVELHMPGSQVEKLWHKGQNIRNLKKIDLRSSRQLIEVPDLSECQNMESIDLCYCTSLVEIPSYFEKLDKLKNLDVGDCSNLKNFPEIPTNIEWLNVCGTAIEELPSSVWSCEKLRELQIYSCRYLKNLPSSTCKLNKLQELRPYWCPSLGKVSELPRNITTLNLQGTSIEVVPSSIFESLSGLVSIDLNYCERLVRLPSNICKSKSLGNLFLSGCSKFECFPEILEPMECLKLLYLSGTAVKELSASSIENLIGLKYLPLDMCKNLESVPNNIYNLNYLRDLTFEGCSRLKKLPDGLMISLSSLESLDLSGTKIESLPANIKQVSGLRDLDISNCKSLRSLQLQDLPLNLRHLGAHGCTSLETVSSSNFELTHGLDMCFSPTPTRIFSNCLKLDQNARSNLLMDDHHAPLGIMRLATRPKRSPGLGICCPGNEIPKWFSYQTEGSSINIKLPPHWFDSYFMGFALCAVVAFHNFTPDYLRNEFKCKSHFTNNKGESLEFYFQLFRVGLHWKKKRTVSSDHVLVWYHYPLNLQNIQREYKGPTTLSNMTMASFDLYPTDKNGQTVILDSVNIKKCGMCLLYAQEAE